MKSGAELINPYDNNREKTDQVEEMFDSIAPAYDFMNSAMSFGLHRYWRNCALNVAYKMFGANPPAEILDIACGTGDVTFELNRRFPSARIIGMDLSTNMLAIADKRLKKLDQSHQNAISFEKGNCLAMRYRDNVFDLITIAYGVRNLENLSVGLKEIYRVLKPGAVLCVIELSEPRGAITSGCYKLYSRRIIPFVGRIISGDSRAYSYLPESIAAAPQRDHLTRLMTEAGFRNCSWKSLTFGAITYYFATKPVAV